MCMVVAFLSGDACYGTADESQHFLVAEQIRKCFQNVLEFCK